MHPSSQPLPAFCWLVLLSLVPSCSQVPVAPGAETGVARTTKPPTDFPNRAALWRMSRYRDEHGRVPARAWQRAIEHRQRVVAATQAVDSGGVAPMAWTSRGPANVAGRARTIVIDPRNSQRIFVGAVSGGLWLSTDGGANWNIVDDWWSNLSVGTVAMDPRNPDVMYVGTGEGFYSLAHLDRNLSHFVRGAGMLKSTDGGRTWTHLTATANWQHVTRIAISPSNSSVLLASRRPGGIARSTDGGATWADVATGDFSYQVLFDPNDGTKAVAHMAPTSALGHRVITSTNAGQSWQVAATGLANVSGENSRIELAYAPSMANMVYASVGLDGGRIWRSTDGGRNWTRRSSSSSRTGTRYYYNCLWVDPTNHDVLVVGALHINRSTNGGQSLTRITSGYIMTVDPHLDVHAIVADPNYNGTSNARVYVATDGGIHRANNIKTVRRGSGWVDLDDTMRSSQFYGADGHHSGNFVVGGTQDNGTLRLRGASPTANLAFGGDGGQVQIDPTNPNYIYGEYQYLGAHRSTNGGSSSRTITSGLGDFGSGRSNFISPLRLDPNNPRRLYAGGRSLWRTADARASNVGWQAVKGNVGSLISAIDIAEGNANLAFVGHNDGRLYRSNNATSGAPSWTAVDDNGSNNPLPNRVLTRIAVDPRQNNVVYASFGGFAADNLWRSIDSGANWRALVGTGARTLPPAPVYGIAVHPDDSSVLYVATEVGVFASDDGGAHWSASNQGPANVVCEQIKFMHGNGPRTLVVATLGRGIWTAEVVRPTATSYGTACSGHSQPPLLGVDPLAPARIGEVLKIAASRLRVLPRNANLLLGTSNRTWGGSTLPLPLDSIGMTGCSLNTSPDVIVTSPISGAGRASWSIPVPNLRSLLGGHFYAQVFASDPGRNQAGLAVSRGLDVGVGW